MDLGIEVKIQNIERTERAKKQLLQSGKLSTGPWGVTRWSGAPVHLCAGGQVVR